MNGTGGSSLCCLSWICLMINCPDYSKLRTELANIFRYPCYVNFQRFFPKDIKFIASTSTLKTYLKFLRFMISSNCKSVNNFCHNNTQNDLLRFLSFLYLQPLSYCVFAILIKLEYKF